MIIHMKSLTVTKLDGRFKYYKQGFRFRISLNVRDEKTNYRRGIKWCEETFGAEWDWTSNSPFDRRRRWNSNWRVTVPKNKQWRQMFFKEESNVSMFLLVVSQ